MKTKSDVDSYKFKFSCAINIQLFNRTGLEDSIFANLIESINLSFKRMLGTRIGNAKFHKLYKELKVALRASRYVSDSDSLNEISAIMRLIGEMLSVNYNDSRSERGYALQHGRH